MATSRAEMRAALLTLVLSAAACGGSSAPTAPSETQPVPTRPPAGASPVVAAMFNALDAYIAGALANERDSLLRNPHLAAYINAKIALLSRPGLGAAISAGGWYAEGSVRSTNGRTLPLATLFPAPEMRAEAELALREIERSLPLLETFLAVPFVDDDIWLWYGFTSGNRGGSGVVSMTDRTNYDARPPSDRIPYDAILVHELAHSYIEHESLTQFLELYAYNVLRTGSPNVQTWLFTRGYTGVASSNTGVAALLDIYQLIGPDAMAGGYRAILPLRPPHGSPLSDSAKEAFVQTLPDSLRDPVRVKLSAVTF